MDVRTISMAAPRRMVIGAHRYATRSRRGSDTEVDSRLLALLVQAFHLEPGVLSSAALEEAFSRALDPLRRTVDLERVVRR